jgi:hypothetical protein
MSIFAVIDDATNICDNVTVLDEGATWAPPFDHYIVNIDGKGVGLGWHYDPSTGVWVGPPSASASFSPSPIFVGQTTALSWDCTGADTVTISSLPFQTFPSSGSYDFTYDAVGSQTVTVTGTNVAGSATATATVRVYATSAELENATTLQAMVI